MRLKVPAILAAALGLGATPVVPLPSGTYTYAIHADGKVTATSTVTVTHKASTITVQEAVSAEGQTRTSKRVLDPATLSTLSWSGPIENGSPDSVIVSAKSATYRHGSSSTLLKKPAPDAPSAVFDFFVAEYATLPAMLQASGAKKYNEFCTCIGGFEVKAIDVVASTAKPPAGARPGDVAIGLSNGSVTATLWYDPHSYVMSELDFPNENVSYVRLSP